MFGVCMRFKVAVTEDFKEWWAQLSVKQREDVLARVKLLEDEGPSLGRQGGE